MEYPLSEIIDRLSILELKEARLPPDSNISQELRRFRQAAGGFGVAERQLFDWIREQRAINGKIWDLEAGLRLMPALKAIDLEAADLEVIGRKAIEIRDLNAARIAHRNIIARAMGEFEELKIDHLSTAAEGPPYCKPKGDGNV